MDAATAEILKKKGLIGQASQDQQLMALLNNRAAGPDYGLSDQDKQSVGTYIQNPEYQRKQEMLQNAPDRAEHDPILQNMLSGMMGVGSIENVGGKGLGLLRGVTQEGNVADATKLFQERGQPGEIQSTPGRVIGKQNSSLKNTLREIKNDNSREDLSADLQQRAAIPENVELLHDADGIPVVKTSDPAHRSKMGIHLTDPTEHEIQDAIDVAHRDNFPAIYVHTEKTPSGGEIKQFTPSTNPAQIQPTPGKLIGNSKQSLKDTARAAQQVNIDDLSSYSGKIYDLERKAETGRLTDQDRATLDQYAKEITSKHMRTSEYSANHELGNINKVLERAENPPYEFMKNKKGVDILRVKGEKPVNYHGDINLTDPSPKDINAAVEKAKANGNQRIYVYETPDNIKEFTPRPNTSSPSNAGNNRSENVLSLVQALQNKGRK